MILERIRVFIKLNSFIVTKHILYFHKLRLVFILVYTFYRFKKSVQASFVGQRQADRSRFGYYFFSRIRCRYRICVFGFDDFCCSQPIFIETIIYLCNFRLRINRSDSLIWINDVFFNFIYIIYNFTKITVNR